MKKGALQIMSAGVLVIGITNLLGYVFSEPSLYTWKRDGVGMALPTAIAFSLTGACLLMLSAKYKHKQ